MAAPVVYRGFKFPFQRDDSAFPAAATDEQLIQDSLLQLVLTMQGERVMRPDVGSSALSMVFENNDVVLANLLRAEIQGVIAKYEPRVRIVDLLTEQKGPEVTVTIVYVVLATKRISTLTVALPSP